jgi:hypothetical protein
MPRLVLCATVALLAVLPASARLEERDTSFSFAVLGDTPYFAWEALRLEQLIAQLNQEDVAFVLHVGDIKSGRDHCDDRIYASRLQLFQQSRHPLVLLPGDNDWTDCHRRSNGSFDPVERLEHLRRVFHSGNHSLGQHPMPLQRQSDDPAFAPFRENMRWQIGAVVFAAVHVVGSHNNQDQPVEFEPRNRANLAWTDAAFDAAEAPGVRALVIAIHADTRLKSSSGSTGRRGFEDFLHLLHQRCEALGKPVLLIHGDSHRFEWDQPWPCLRRLESFGSPTVGWVRVTVNPAAEGFFSVEAHR